MFKHRDNLESEFLPPAIEIEETPHSPFKRLLIWAIFFITVSAFVWSCVGEVDEVAVARGKVIPDGRVKVIQPIEAGVIKAILVQEGQRVKKGELLIELDLPSRRRMQRVRQRHYPSTGRIGKGLCKN